ncbi:Ankyrin [Pseudopedobacter saltans DSM 12145]|uniref:Ankyrin n=1 Tax=Pseudopedobacter saltans (strain ATCC 51119 / DSM 12145 / JCM 21818 / CCUG 39354 / LMG 10337 / NBRC 100064 / NCIMB 13643) TaxID=762903 RepID=F0SCV2_PSESL|nr:ankyrin repeat domain-containing protein [Pseudopedobacter saltans]ADY50691.1 Ankyrin [Pseudopedobacter saltans DSM 12145]
MRLFLLCLCIFTSCDAKSSSSEYEAGAPQETIVEMVAKSNIKGVKAALDQGADVNTRDRNKRTLLLLATINKNAEMAKMLVTHGADVNMQDNIQDSPFLYAGASGQTELVDLFLKNGARFDVFNRYYGTALIPACERGHVETVKLLANTKNFPINHVNRLGWTALMEAVILGSGGSKYQEIVKILKDRGADLTIPDHNGQTPLQHARLRGFNEIAKILSE